MNKALPPKLIERMTHIPIEAHLPEILTPAVIAKAMALSGHDVKGALLRFGHRPTFTIDEAVFIGLKAPLSFAYRIKTTNEVGEKAECFVYVRAEETLVTKTIFFVADY